MMITCDDVYIRSELDYVILCPFTQLPFVKPLPTSFDQKHRLKKKKKKTRGIITVGTLMSNNAK